MSERKLCMYCGKFVDNGQIVNDIFYCKECVEKLFFICSDCDEFYPKDEKHDAGEGFVCDECFGNYNTCNSCNYISHMDDGWVRYYEAYDGCLCSDCYSNYFFYCENCNSDILNCNESHVVNGQKVCEVCYQESIIDDSGLLLVLKDFIGYERDNLLPLPTIRAWIIGLLGGTFICPCRIMKHNCGTYTCPRNLDACRGNSIYQLFNGGRSFVRWYLLRHLVGIYSGLTGRKMLFRDLI